MLVQKGYALVHAACVALDGKAVLVTAPTDTGKTATILRLLMQDSFAFLSDDMIILRGDGLLMSYPKPLTISRHTLAAVNGAPLSRWERPALQIKSRLQSKLGRQTAGILARLPQPLASINALFHMVLSPPRYSITRLIPGVRIGQEAAVSQLVALERGPDLHISFDPLRAATTLLRDCEDGHDSPLYPALERFLAFRNGEDLRRRERYIVSKALDGCAATLLRSERSDWWERLAAAPQGGQQQP